MKRLAASLLLLMGLIALCGCDSKPAEEASPTAPAAAGAPGAPGKPAGTEVQGGVEKAPMPGGGPGATK